MPDLVSLNSHAISFASLSMVRNTELLNGANCTVFQLFKLRRRGEGREGGLLLKTQHEQPLAGYGRSDREVERYMYEQLLDISYYEQCVRKC